MPNVMPMNARMPFDPTQQQQKFAASTQSWKPPVQQPQQQQQRVNDLTVPGLINHQQFLRNPSKPAPQPPQQPQSNMQQRGMPQKPPSGFQGGTGGFQSMYPATNPPTPTARSAAAMTQSAGYPPQGYPPQGPQGGYG